MEAKMHLKMPKYALIKTFHDLNRTFIKDIH